MDLMDRRWSFSQLDEDPEPSISVETGSPSEATTKASSAFSLLRHLYPRTRKRSWGREALLLAVEAMRSTTCLIYDSIPISHTMGPSSSRRSNRSSIDSMAEDAGTDIEMTCDIEAKHARSGSLSSGTAMPSTPRQTATL
jgi:hypothetical protein